MTTPRLLLVITFLVFSFHLFSNDNCEDAQLLNCGDVIMSNTNDASMDTAPYCGTLINASGVWYQLKGTGDEVQVNTCLSAYDTRLSIYEGNCEALVCLGGNDDRCGLQSRINFNTVEGTAYYILVNGSNGATGDFRLEIICVEKGCIDEEACNYNPVATVDDGNCNEPDCSGNCAGEETGPALAGAPCDDGNPLTTNSRYNENCNCQPEGITCDYPLIISQLPFSVTGNTENFENYYNENPCESAYLIGNDFIMEFTPETTGYYNLKAANLSYKAGLLVFESCPDQTGAVCVARSTSSSEIESIHRLMLSENTSYYIIISTTSNEANSNFSFSLNRSIISGCTNTAACNYNELAEMDDDSCFNCEDESCPGDVCDDGDPNTPKSVYDDNCICIVPQLGINCEFPVRIDSIPYSFSGNTADYENNYFDNPCDSYFLTGNEFVMEFTPTITGDYNLNNGEALSYAWLLVYQNCPDQADALCLGSSANKIDLLSLKAGITYYIVIADFEGFDSSDFNFYIERNIIHGCTDETACNYNPLAEVDDQSCFSCNLNCPGDVCDDGDPGTPLSLYDKNCQCVAPLPGVSCDNPFVVETLPFNISQSTDNLFVDYNVNPCGDKYLEGDEFVFEFTPPITDEYLIYFTNFVGSVRVSIYDACPDKENTNCIGRPSSTKNVFELNSDTIYYIIFSSANSSSTFFNFGIQLNALHGCKDVNACNYNEEAIEDNGSCINCGIFCPGDPCDDGNPYTENTEYNSSCDCVVNTKLIDHRGKDFWLMFNSNNYFGYEGNGFHLFITGNHLCNGIVEIPGINYSQPFFVQPGSVTEVVLPDTVEFKPETGIADKAVHISATEEVVIYGLNQQRATTDAFTNIPTDALGTEYIISSYGDGLFGVVATENNTQVSINFPLNLMQDSLLIQLNKGQAYQFYGDIPYYGDTLDVTGTIIESDKPVGVFGGNNCTYIPIETPACDHIVEQFAPVDAWGKQFYAVSLATRKNGDLFRMVAAYDNTVVQINGRQAATLNRGEFYEEILPSDSLYDINANQPIQLTQYSLGSLHDNVLSDPFMMMIPPYEQYSGNTTFTTPGTNIPINYINIVSPKGGVGKIKIDDVLIPAKLYEQIGNSNFYGLRMRIKVGAHNINGDNIPFGAFIYGFGSFDSYGYPAGAIFSPALSVTSISLSPPSATVNAQEEHCVQATLFDQFEQPVASVRVDFEVNNTHTETGFAFTNENGVATFCYTGYEAGEDEITATVADVDTMVMVTWMAPVIQGCTEILACNYNPMATIDDGSCIQTGCVLPIDLIAFSGEALAEGNLLKWVTASEAENEYFTLRSSSDGVQFSSVTTINGNGTTSEQTSYQYLDRTIGSGLTYYQLEQTDFDGTQSKSNIISVERGDVHFEFFDLYPIPSSNFIQLTFSASLDEMVHIKLVDLTGKVLYLQQNIGKGKIENLTLNLSSFTAGIYFVQLYSNDTKVMKKIIVE